MIQLGKEVFYNPLKETGIPMKVAKLIKVCPNETCSRVQLGKHLSHILSIRNVLKQGDALSPLLLIFGIE
jgi:hypothetical protein